MNYFSGKTILITGATGLVGSNLVFDLMKINGARVIAMGRDIEKGKKVFEKYNANVNFVFCAQDIATPIQIEEPVDIIFHAAGPIAGSIIKNSPLDVINPNLIGVLNCLEFLREQEQNKNIKGKLIVLSSATVYGDAGEIDRMVSEEDTQNASQLDSIAAPYSESKRMVEVIATSYARQYSMEVLIARLSYVYGYTICKPDTAFYQFVNTMSEGKDIVFKNAGIGRRDNIYVKDAVTGLLTVAEKGQTGNAYNISSGGDKGNFVAIDEMAEIMAECKNKIIGNSTISVVYPKEKASASKAGIILSNSKLKALGWEIKTNIFSGIEETIAAYHREEMGGTR